MAVRHGYGKIAGADALVFAYDTGDTRNSYRGEPTTNIMPYSEQFSSWGAGDVVLTANAATAPDGTQTAYLLGANNVATYHYLYQYITTQSSTTYTFSCYVKPAGGFNGDTDTFFMQTNDGSWKNTYFYLSTLTTSSGTGTIIPLADGWYRVSWTVSIATGGSLAWYLYPSPSPTADSSGGGYYIWGAQLEAKGHMTQYLPTGASTSTRSATQGLLDLTGNHTIDLSNMSFDSNAQKTFDGTNDFIDTGYASGDIATPTLEAVVYRSTSTGRYEAIIQNNVATDDALYVYPAGNLGFWPCTASSLTVPTGQWSHVAVSYDGTNLTYTVNGAIQVVTATCTHITDWDFLRIGAAATSDGERWIGEIPVVKIYNRALSASELLSNYRHYKNRFNIS